MTNRWLSLIVLFAVVSCQSSVSEFPAGEVVDLTHGFDAEAIFWPTGEGFVLEKVSEGVTPGGYYYASNKFRMAEHGGTHIDAPIHFFRGGRTVDKIPLTQLIGPGIVVDTSEACAGNSDYLVSVDDFKAWEEANGPIPEHAMIVLRTGYGMHWPDRVRYMGTDERGPEAVPKLHFPGLSPDGARWLIAQRKPRAVGIDTASIDFGQSKRFETHQVLFGNDIPALENLANLEKLPARNFTLIALPMKITGGSGGPLRVIALLPEKKR